MVLTAGCSTSLTAHAVFSVAHSVAAAFARAAAASAAATAAARCSEEEEEEEEEEEAAEAEAEAEVLCTVCLRSGHIARRSTSTHASASPVPTTVYRAPSW